VHIDRQAQRTLLEQHIVFDMRIGAACQKQLGQYNANTGALVPLNTKTVEKHPFWGISKKRNDGMLLKGLKMGAGNKSKHTEHATHP